MTIDINISQPRSDGPRRQESVKESSVSRSRPETVAPVSREPSTADSVSLSSAAKTLVEIENSLKALPEVDRSRVEAIKARIESGEYQINPENVAQKMLDMEK